MDPYTDKAFRCDQCAGAVICEAIRAEHQTKKKEKFHPFCGGSTVE
jgi:hypothetical protein